MKKALLIGISFLGVFFCIPNISHAERIDDFSTTITIQKTGEVRVVEKITYDFENISRHGIFRNILTQNSDGSEIGIKDISVTNNQGGNYTYIQKDSPQGITLQIGDPSKTVSGKNVYNISYIVSNALVSFEDYNELYWNVTGNNWKVPIDNATVSVIGEQIIQASCYRGKSGSLQQCSKISTENFSVHENYLDPGEGITIAVAFPKEGIAGITRIGGQLNGNKQIVSQSNSFIKFLLLIIGSIIVGGLMWLRWGSRDSKTTKPVVAWYEPPYNLAPMVLGTLIDKETDMRDIVAQIISLAERGYISITRIEEKQLLVFKSIDYLFMVNKSTDGIISSIDLNIFKLLFATEQPPVGMQTHMSDIKKRSSDGQLIIKNLKDLTEIELIQAKFFTPVRNNSTRAIIQLLGIAMVYCAVRFKAIISPFEYIIIPIGIITAMVLVSHKNNRTQLGVDTTQEILGFKEFLSITDKERFNFHNAPEKNPKQFMEFLPYAIAFGVEEKWAKQFEGILIPKPIWYQGASATFLATDFARDMHAFGTGMTQTVIPASSGSGGSGFSGGGSGGGGGGSW